jgi:crotonobetainyl-CoA:carnitine CoA-transferase CaiB-like acyl-CoA transferase
VFSSMSAEDARGDRLPIVPARPLGADTDDVLRSTGLTDAVIASLRAGHVI